MPGFQTTVSSEIFCNWPDAAKKAYVFLDALFLMEKSSAFPKVCRKDQLSGSSEGAPDVAECSNDHISYFVQAFACLPCPSALFKFLSELSKKIYLFRVLMTKLIHQATDLPQKHGSLLLIGALL